jgi:hypothetical protein
MSDEVQRLRDLIREKRPHTTCLYEPERVEKTLLAGDLIEKVTSAIGIKPCSGCGRRKDAINRLHQKLKRAIRGGSAV